tara:strand:- start:1278 stop:2102 length:825 start_codon:yes stop_codon:yes gene_type:complete
MADTTILELNKLTTGSHSGTWGDLTNDNMSKIDTSIKGYQSIAITGTTQTLTTGSAGTGNQINNASLQFTGTLSNNTDIVCPAQDTWYFVDDATARTGSDYTLTFKPSGGSGVLIQPGAKHILYTDGSTMVDIGADMGNLKANGTLTATGNVSFDGGTLTYNATKADLDATFSGDDDTNLLKLDASTDSVGIGVATPAAKLEVDQNSGTGAIPVLELDQGDSDQPFCNFAGSSAADSSSSISSSTAEAASKFGAIMVKINGSTSKWIRIYDTAI